jgi:hypothetical protein
VPVNAWIWGTNIVADLSTILPDLGGLAGVANTTFRISLVDHTGAEVSYVEYSATYNVFFDAINSIWVTQCTQSRPVFGPDFQQFSGIQVKSTNDNTAIVPDAVQGNITLFQMPIFSAVG